MPPLEAYLDLVAAWGRRANLTGARTPAARVRVLVEPVLPAAPLIAKGRLIDVGSGNGSPGLVLALLRRDIEVVLLEPRLKRWSFLREAARAVARAGLEVLRLRHEEYPGPPAETVTVRALKARLADLARLVSPGGAVLVFGGDAPAEPPFVAEGAVPLVRGRLQRFRRERST